MIGSCAVSLAHAVGWHELRICVDGDERPEVTNPVWIIHRLDVALLLSNVAPHLVHLDSPAWGILGDRVRQLDPGFDPRTYGHRQLSLLMRELGAFEMNEIKSPEGPTVIYVKPKD